MAPSWSSAEPLGHAFSSTTFPEPSFALKRDSVKGPRSGRHKVPRLVTLIGVDGELEARRARIEHKNEISHAFTSRHICLHAVRVQRAP